MGNDTEAIQPDAVARHGDMLRTDIGGILSPYVDKNEGQQNDYVDPDAQNSIVKRCFGLQITKVMAIIQSPALSSRYSNKNSHLKVNMEFLRNPNSAILPAYF